MTQYVLSNMSEMNEDSCTAHRLHLVSAELLPALAIRSKEVSAKTLAGMQAEGDTFKADNRDARIVPAHVAR